MRFDPRYHDGSALIPLMAIIFLTAAVFLFVMTGRVRADCKDEITKNDMNWIEAIKISRDHEERLAKEIMALKYTHDVLTEKVLTNGKE